MIELLSMLRYKSEGTDIDFKSAQYRFTRGTEEEKSELLKDILAIANAWRDGPGYILLGFKENRPHPAEIIGIQESIDDSRLQQFVNSKVKPKLTFSYEEHLYDGKKVGVITIPKQKRPFYITSAYGKLKSNVVYVRRGSSTDEAEPPEAIAMANDDNGRGDVRVELSVLTPQNEALPSSFAHTYLQFTEEFPDFVMNRKSSGPFDMHLSSSLERDNSDFWREYAEYTQVDEALIQMQFVLVNRSAMQLSSAKLEVVVEALDSQPFQMIAGSDIPERPKSTWNLASLVTVHEVLAKQKANLVLDESGQTPVCHIRLGSLLPGEQGRSETLAIIPQGPGRLCLRLRILGSELAVPIEQEHVIETTGETHLQGFAEFSQFVREKLEKRK